MSAPMAMHSGGTLAAAVTVGGGLGSFGGVHLTKGPDWLRSQVEIVRAATDGPFAIGFITPFLEATKAMFDAALEARPSAIAFSFSDPAQWVEPARAAGARIICQVQTPNDAAAAVAAGTDVLVVQGTEAGGHTGTMSLLPLLSHVASRYPDIPVLAAGGVADGRTLAAALMAGADGVWMGTAFLATDEAVEIGDAHKQLVVDSDGADTVFTQAYDILSGAPWPSHIGERVRRNDFTKEWEGRTVELRARRDEIVARRGPRNPESAPDPDQDPILYGLSAALVPSVRPAAEVVRSISQEAEQILRTRPDSLLD